MLATNQERDALGLSATSRSFLALRNDVLTIWEREVRARVDGARDLLSPVLLNTLPAFYGNIAEALTPSYSKANATSDNNAASAHGGERARLTSFGVDQVIQEYQILRDAIRSASAGRLRLGPDDWAVIENSINCAEVEAVRALMISHDELRKRVAASLSHDMRAPLSVIATGASLIGMAQDLVAARRAAAKIEANAQRLSDMVGELLDALTDPASAAVTLDVRQFNIQHLVQSVCEELNEGQPGRFEASGDFVTGYWCETCLRRAVENLATNAKKYGDGGVVRIKAETCRERLALSVHNTGNHIPKDAQERIFDYLQRGAQSTHGAGWGIGLQYVKKVAEAHGGSVIVDSSQEAGTTFIIDLPIDCRLLAPKAAKRPSGAVGV